jgi:hypothetical protein
MDAVLDQLRSDDLQVSDEDIARLSPLGHELINVLGCYSLTLPETVFGGELSPLTNPGFRLMTHSKDS